MRSWLILLAACGGTAPAPPPIATALEPVSCGDASKILRGTVTSEDPAAGPARESAILRSCQGDAWSRAVLACIGSARPPASCIAKLDDKQRDSYQAKLDTWDAQYAVAPDPIDDAPPRIISCEEVHVPLATFPPKLEAASAERDWQLQLRTTMIADACEKEWSEATRECLVDDDVATCEVTSPDLAPLVTRMTAVDETAQKIAAARLFPTSITCEKVVAAHYAPASWKDKLQGAKDRAQQIARSRKAMQAACTSELWSEQERACIVVGGDTARCYASDLEGLRFGYPALAISTHDPNLPLACKLYGAVVERFAACAAVPLEARTALKEAFAQTEKLWASMPAAELESVGEACKLGGAGLLAAFPACS